jgi:hypothetical protein
MPSCSNNTNTLLCYFSRSLTLSRHCCSSSNFVVTILACSFQMLFPFLCIFITLLFLHYALTVDISAMQHLHTLCIIIHNTVANVKSFSLSLMPLTLLNICCPFTTFSSYHCLLIPCFLFHLMVLPQMPCHHAAIVEHVPKLHIINP